MVKNKLVTFDIWNTLIKRDVDLEAIIASKLSITKDELNEKWYNNWFTENISFETFLAHYFSNYEIQEAISTYNYLKKKVVILEKGSLLMQQYSNNNDFVIGVVSDCDRSVLEAIQYLNVFKEVDLFWLSFQQSCKKQSGLYDIVKQYSKDNSLEWVNHIGDHPFFDKKILPKPGPQCILI